VKSVSQPDTIPLFANNGRVKFYNIINKAPGLTRRGCPVTEFDRQRRLNASVCFSTVICDNSKPIKLVVSQSGDLADSNRTVCLGRTGLNCDFTSPNNGRQCQVVGNQGYTYNIFQEQRECHTATKMPFMYSSSGNCVASVPVSTFMCSVSNFYIPTIDLYILPQEICGPILGIYKSHPRHMNVEIGTEAAQFPGKECINGIFVAVLQVNKE